MPSVWDGFDGVAQEIMQLAGVRDWYATRNHFFSYKFQKYVEGPMTAASKSQTVFYNDPACIDNSR